MPITPITDVGQAFLTALAAFLAAIPAIIGALLLLIIGWVIAGLVGGILAKFLRTIKVDDLAEKSGIAGFLRRGNVKADAAGVIGGLVKWYIRLVFIVMAANAVGLTAVSGIVGQVLAFLPNLLVAILILGVFSWLATTAKNLVTGAVEGAGMPNASALGMITFVAVLGFGIVAAANQIGVAATLINTLFMGIVGAMALAFGLAFGLGGREQAAQIWSDWRRQGTQAMEKAKESGPQMLDEAQARRRREELTRRS